METKEINVWIHKSHDIDNWYIGASITQIDQKHKPDYVKARLIIEVEEPRRELTPTMIKKAYYSRACTDHGLRGVLKELFGDFGEDE